MEAGTGGTGAESGWELITFHGDPNKMPTFFANGAFGGADPFASVVIVNLYIEQKAVPVAATVKEHGYPYVDQDKIHKDMRSDIQRILQARLVITSQFARSLAMWLYQQADKIDNEEG